MSNKRPATPSSKTNNAPPTNAKWTMFVLLLAAVVIIVVLYSNMKEQRDLAESYRDSMQSSEQALKKVEIDRGQQALALREAERRAQAAEEARRMASEAESETAYVEAEEMEALKEKLEQEALAREEAETSLETLKEKAVGLDASLESGDDSALGEGQDSISKEESIPASARASEVSAEEVISKEGAEVDMDNFRILSPNFKRNGAVRWQERH